MACFRFSMQNILNMKEKLEDQAKNKYAQANARLLREQEKLEIIVARREEAREKLKLVLYETLSVAEIRTRENAVEVLKFYAMQQQLAVKRCEKEVEVAREELGEAMKERKIFEKLREKAFEEFVFEENRKEQKEVDELMSYKHGTKAV
ncbi:MAG: flagellar export protein FliJ [Eubacterium sp.]|nr:flagellar export protein FliJ [Eubacterium sp.]